MAIEKCEVIRERGPRSGGGVFWIVIALIFTLAGVVAFNGGANIRLHPPSRFDFDAAKA